MENKTAEQAQILANRLQKRFKHLKKWARATAQRSGVGAFRLYDRDIPEIPLVLDYYACNVNSDSAFPPDAALCGALYKRPYEKDEDEEAKWLSAMKESAASALNIEPQKIFLKQRKRKEGIKQYEKMSAESFEKTISEGGLLFKVNLSDYLDTGFFIDRRLLRTMIRSESAGKRVLNLFSYTGAFSACAAAGGAVSTDSVDLSNTYLNWAQENFKLNGMTANIVKYYDEYFGRISHEGIEPSVLKARRTQKKENKVEEKNTTKINTLMRADVLDFLDRAVRAKFCWDIIILDPPAFSNSKKMTDTLDLNRDLAELTGKCLKLLTTGGKIYLSVNLRKSVPTAAELETELKNAHVTDITDKLIDEDFKGKKIPKSFLILKN